MPPRTHKPRFGPTAGTRDESKAEERFFAAWPHAEKKSCGNDAATALRMTTKRRRKRDSSSLRSGRRKVNACGGTGSPLLCLRGVLGGAPVAARQCYFSSKLTVMLAWVSMGSPASVEGR